MGDIPEIDVQEAKIALQTGDHLFFDIRDPASYTTEHIPGAIHVHDGNVEELVKTTDKEKPIIVYCFHGINSVGGAAYFIAQGFKTVHSLQGGFEEWTQRGTNDQENPSCS